MNLYGIVLFGSHAAKSVASGDLAQAGGAATITDNCLDTLSLSLQIGVAIYALWLNRLFGTRKAGWALSGAFLLMLAMHLNEAVFPPVTVTMLSLKPQLAYVFISMLLLIGLSHVAAMYRERQKIEAAMRKTRDELEIRVQERTAALAAEVEQRKQAEQEIRAALEERKRMAVEVEKTHQQLLVASRQAGMAEVATSVLHNVGNVLNSLNISAQVIGQAVKRARIGSLGRVAPLLQEHAASLDQFLLQDPKGRQIPEYLARLAENMTAEEEVISKEIGVLNKHVDHIKQIVAMQQSYAGLSGVSETVEVSELVEDALRMSAGSIERWGIAVTRDYEGKLPKITVEKHKVLQILVNLIRNAKHACHESGRSDQQIQLHVRQQDDHVEITVRDNGVGIAPENSTRIFTHGFTTRKGGHGFGLHCSALAAKEMGGSLAAQSDGPGHGAQFTLMLPLVKPQTESETTQPQAAPALATA